MDIKYIEAIGSLSPKIKDILSDFPSLAQEKVREIGIRTDKPLTVSCFDGVYFARCNGGFTKNIPMTPYIVTADDLLDCLFAITQYSLHSCKNDINAGFVTLKGGHRAGLSGSCVYENERIHTVNDISSVNLRVARQIKGAADELINRIYRERVVSTLIAGAPASGKTTMLRDIARGLGNGAAAYYPKISLIDERGEIASMHNGRPQNDVGILTDVFDGYKKRDGMALALRSMSPQVIMLDEISGEADVNGIMQSINSGTSVIATIHASEIDELYRKPWIEPLIHAKCFEKIVILKGRETPCEINDIISVGKTAFEEGKSK